MAVFGHGQLRLYLLSLLEAGPRHGYELIRALSDRFGGTYRPSAGTVYPRLARLEEEGLVERAESGRKTLYALTDRGRAEVEAHRAELAALEHELADVVRELAAQVRAEVAGSMAGMRAEMAAAAQQARAAALQARDARATAPAGDVPRPGGPPAAGSRPGGPGADARREARARRAAIEADLAAFRAEVREAVRRAEASGGPTALTADTVRTVLASARAAIAATLPPR
ncbi:PadR family transcriptional regulator [Cellulomonas sp.]|uniref:PadR family transcriptional regulator n=1 Tax=Cellulomonas sp. TaxID=40001 RepID=UPI002D67EF86|nr:PadR family transcriptional regulator [Cellulomonas sp.]HYQ76507.1 PadR family transcriptional regulator [Cellulomonas sp.]